MIIHQSPNFNDRPGNVQVSLLVFHYTGMETAEAALERMCDSDAQVSAHYMIDEDGTMYSLVPENKRAWHAGISCWHGRAALNDVSIGIELVNPGHEFGYRPFPQAQMDVLKDLSHDLIERYHIHPVNVVGHSDIAPRRKQDPGELFDWQNFAKAGIGVWPDVPKVKKPEEILLHETDEGSKVMWLQHRLSEYGYHIREDGFYGKKTAYIVEGFKRHFVPEQVSGKWDRLADARLQVLFEWIVREKEKGVIAV